ncbi:amidohydrolase [Arabiibacter massiliensis]|uniref:amidohydrolase n=1 Tax=Arabiibacter massiliensis TaxID=1870985 RepID=UPI0009BBBBE6|nr:amidohydrolase family protein [Arabiibacter massiliensis]
MKAYHGSIITVDPSDSEVAWLVEEEGRIAYIGDTLPSRYAHSEIVELGERALCPSFVDTHEHFASFATFNAGLNVMNASSNSIISNRVKEYASECSDQTIIAFGASPHSVKEGRLITKAELDAACPDKPVMVVKYDGHACIVNTALLEKVAKRIDGLRGFHPDTGEMNQEAFFGVSNYITGSLSISQLVKNMQRAMDYLAERGIGMVHTASGVGFAGNLDISLEKWVGKSAQNGFQIRVYPQSMDTRVAVERKIPRIGGCFACALDGCFGSIDAAMNEPYAGVDERGVLYYTDEEVITFCKRANRAGLQIEMHAIGDAAFDQATRAIKAALDDFPRVDHRHGIIHACLPTDKGMAICAEYEIQLPMQPSFIDWPQEPNSYLDGILGVRSRRLNPLRELWDAGITLSSGSDAPCTDPNPLLWIQRACNHTDPYMSLSIREALRMCTYNGYWTSFDEKERGSLEEGKIADMVVLSANPYKTPVKLLHTLRVEDLILGGSPYQPQSQGIARALALGIANRAKV